MFQGSLRASVAAFALAAGTICIASPALAQAGISLPSASLADSLAALSRQSNVQILYDQALLRGKKARAVNRASSVEAALAQLLRDSGLTWQKRGDAFLIVQQTASTKRPPGATRAERREDAGAITGQVLNGATGEYMLGAIVEIQPAKGPKLQTTTDDTGKYQLSRVPAGQARVTIRFQSHPDQTQIVTVKPGTIAEANATFGEGTDESGIIVVSAVREGNAKAFMERRQTMDIANILNADTFGDIPDGNVGEFLQYIPGVEVAITSAEPRGVGMRGLGPEYTSVTLDRILLASSQGSGVNNSTRTFTLEGANLGVVGSVEVIKTLSADMDANAPAGAINLRTRRAFELKKRRIVVTGNLAAHGDYFSFAETPGPGSQETSRKIRPGGSITYSDVFFDHRLGISLGVSTSNVWQSWDTTTYTYNRTPTATDTRPQVISTIDIKNISQTQTRNSYSGTIDFRATDKFSLGLTAMYNTATLFAPNRSYLLTAGTRGSVTGDGLTSFTSATNGAIASNTEVGVNKTISNLLISPSFDWKIGSVKLTGRFAYSSYEQRYPHNDPSVYTISALSVSGVQFTAQRSGLDSDDWRITQVAGKDVANPASYPISSPYMMDDGRTAREKKYIGTLDAEWESDFGFPIDWKAGVKFIRQDDTYDNRGTLSRYTYIGTPANYWVGKVSGYPLVTPMSGASIVSISGQPIFVPDPVAAYADFKAHPENYRQNNAVADYLASNVTNHRIYSEEVRAAYLMATAHPSNNLSVRIGMRYEGTDQLPSVANPYTAAETKAAGYTVTASTGVANTIAGIDYQYLSRPYVRKKSSYNEFFPSASIKWQISPNTDIRAAFSTTMRRPDYAMVAAVETVDDVNGKVTINNPNLRPEKAVNFALRFEHYSRNLGLLAVTFYDNEIKNMFLSSTLTADEYGNTDPALSGYQFVTYVNSDNAVSIQGIELEFNHDFGFVAPFLKPLTLMSSFTHNSANKTLTSMTPNLATARLNYALGRFSIYSDIVWTDDKPSLVGDTNRWLQARTNVTLGANWNFAPGWKLTGSVRNLLNAPLKVMEQVGTNTPVVNNRQFIGRALNLTIRAQY